MLLGVPNLRHSPSQISINFPPRIDCSQNVYLPQYYQHCKQPLRHSGKFDLNTLFTSQSQKDKLLS